MKLVAALLLSITSGYLAAQTIATSIPAGFVKNYYSTYSNTPTAAKLILSGPSKFAQLRLEKNL